MGHERDYGKSSGYEQTITIIYKEYLLTKDIFNIQQNFLIFRRKFVYFRIDFCSKWEYTRLKFRKNIDKIVLRYILAYIFNEEKSMVIFVPILGFFFVCKNLFKNGGDDNERYFQ